MAHRHRYCSRHPCGCSCDSRSDGYSHRDSVSKQFLGLHYLFDLLTWCSQWYSVDLWRCQQHKQWRLNIIFNDVIIITSSTKPNSKYSSLQEHLPFKKLTLGNHRISTTFAKTRIRFSKTSASTASKSMVRRTGSKDLIRPPRRNSAAMLASKLRIVPAGYIPALTSHPARFFLSRRAFSTRQRIRTSARVVRRTRSLLRRITRRRVPLRQGDLVATVSSSARGFSHSCYFSVE